MIHALTTFINDAGWLAPLYYVGSFVLAALLPFIPTPLIGALGGTAFGFGPALAYGLIGMGLGALVALTLARRLGRPLLLRIVRPDVWAQWEAFLGIRSPLLWAMVFFVLNLDIAVVAAGLTTVPLSQLWVAAMIARLPWLLASTWFGDRVLVSDTVMWLALTLTIPAIIALNRLRPPLQRWLLKLSARERRRR